jgi:hypothetical protein
MPFDAEELQAFPAGRVVPQVSGRRICLSRSTVSSVGGGRFGVYDSGVSETSSRRSQRVLRVEPDCTVEVGRLRVGEGAERNPVDRYRDGHADLEDFDVGPFPDAGRGPVAGGDEA